MSDDDWDADNFETPVAKPAPGMTDKWDGEDEDDEVRDNWDDEEEKEGKKEEADANAVIQVKKKKPLKERLAEKEETKRKELEEKHRQEEQAKKTQTPQERFEEKLRRQKIQEESDLALAMEAIGLSKEEEPSLACGVIDGFEPKTKEDFDNFSQMLNEKITKYEKSPNYVPFLENLTRDMALNLGAEDLRKIMGTLNALYNEKVKLLKERRNL